MKLTNNKANRGKNFILLHPIQVSFYFYVCRKSRLTGKHAQGGFTGVLFYFLLQTVGNYLSKYVILTYLSSKLHHACALSIHVPTYTLQAFQEKRIG